MFHNLVRFAQILARLGLFRGIHGNCTILTRIRSVNIRCYSLLPRQSCAEALLLRSVYHHILPDFIRAILLLIPLA